MEKSEFKSLLKEIKSEIKINKNIIDKALNEEMCKGNSINFDKIIKLIDNYESIEKFENENKKIAVCYSGNLQVTVTYIFDSIIYNNNVTLCINNHKILNDLLVNIIKDSLVNCKIKNAWINYSSDYNEVYLRDNKKVFDKFVYIGDYFEYERFKSFIKKEVEYNNFGSIKLFIDQSKNKSEYQKIMKYATKENIYLEVYDDVQEFITESKEEDFSVVFGDTKILNSIKRDLKGEMLFNAFPYDSYKFQINR